MSSTEMVDRDQLFRVFKYKT